jgi:putative transposase
MARLPRAAIVIGGLPHHVIVRGNNRRNLFSYPSCYRTFLRLVLSACRRFDVHVHALVLMRNHVHLVVTPRYALRRNRAREGTGKVFEQRYTSIPIRTERQLAATLPYVELNPLRAGIVDASEDWPWSTHRLHIDRDAAPEVVALWTPHPWWTGLGATNAARAAAYLDLTQRRLEAHRATFVAPAARPYQLVTERPDRTRVAEPVCDGMRIHPPDGNDFEDLGPLGVSPSGVGEDGGA